ncbi:MAG: hypothetical protein LQ346_000645 [Caloplaca aetnensis]|nr:MAG: hypothetical protein LQ346_000645 [Caloplaca aetnensis]
MSLHQLYIIILFHLFYYAHGVPLHPLRILNASSLVQDPDFSPLIYHVPNSHNTLYILPYDYALPSDGFRSSIYGARVYIAHKIADAEGKASLPLPPDEDPFVYGLDLTVKITWQSFRGMKLTWGTLAAAMRGLDDCLVKNNQLAFAAVWHVFDSRQEGEVGWGVIGKGKGLRRAGSVS